MKGSCRAVVRWSVRQLARGILTVGRLVYQLEVHGWEDRSRVGPLIILARHSSRMDFILTAFLFSTGQEFYTLGGNLAVHNNRCLAWLGRELAVFPSFKVRGLSATSLLEAYKTLQQGKIIYTGPEGEIAWDGRLQALRPGAAWLALRTHAPVLVMVLQGGYDICPRWARRPHMTGKLVLRIGKPFYLGEAPCPRVTEAMLREANLRISTAMEALSKGEVAGEETPA